MPTTTQFVVRDRASQGAGGGGCGAGQRGQIKVLGAGGTGPESFVDRGGVDAARIALRKSKTSFAKRRHNFELETTGGVKQVRIPHQSRINVKCGYCTPTGRQRAMWC